MHLKVYMSFPYKDPQLALCTVAPVSTCHRYSFTVHSSNKVNNNKVHCEHPYNSSRNNTLNAIKPYIYLEVKNSHTYFFCDHLYVK